MELVLLWEVPDAIDAGKVREETGPKATRNRLQIPVLLETIEDGQYDAALGGFRRDEEKARAKNDSFQRTEFENGTLRISPELWNIFNGRKHHGEHLEFSSQ